MSLYGNKEKAQNSRTGIIKENMKTIAAQEEEVIVQLNLLDQVIQARTLSNGGVFIPPTVDLGIPGSIWNKNGKLKISSAT